MAPAISRADAFTGLASFDWETWKTALRDLFEPIYADLVASEAKPRFAAAKSGKADHWHADDPYTKRAMTTYVTERITQLDDTTREWVKEAIVDTLDADEGLGATALAAKIADAVQGSRAFDAARALMIARTETAIAYNHGAALGYQQAGVEAVLISDGDGDEPCAEADGEVWSLEYFLANPIEHPNCERSAVPADPDAEVDRE